MCLPAPGGHPPNSQPRTLRPLLSPQPTALLQVTKPWGRARQHSIPAAQSPVSQSTQGQRAAPGQPSPHLQVLQVCVLQLLRGREDLQPRRTRCGRGCDDKEMLGGLRQGRILRWTVGLRMWEGSAGEENPLHPAVGQDWPDLGGVEGRPKNGPQTFSCPRNLQPNFRTNHIPTFPKVIPSKGCLQNLLWGQGDLPWWDQPGLRWSWEGGEGLEELAGPHLVGAQHGGEGAQPGPCFPAQLRAHDVPRVHQEHGHLRGVPAVGQPARRLPNPAPSHPAFSSWPPKLSCPSPSLLPSPRTARIGLDPSVPSPLTFLPSFPSRKGWLHIQMPLERPLAPHLNPCPEPALLGQLPSPDA